MLLRNLVVSVAVTTVAVGGQAQTNFNAGVSTDLRDAGNWDNGLPTSANLGTVAIDGDLPDDPPIDFDFTITTGATVAAAGFQDWGGVDIIVDDGALTSNGRITGGNEAGDLASVTINANGAYNATHNVRSAIEIFVNGGSFTLASETREYLMQQSGSLLSLGTNGAVSVSNLDFRGNGTINFAAESTATLSAANLNNNGAALTWQEIWDNDDLQLDGQNKTDAGGTEFGEIWQVSSGNTLSLLGVVAPLNGDYNDDGIVDAADYTVWRDNLDGQIELLNDGGLGTPISQSHYELWRNNYGSSAGSSAAASAAPEPTAWLLLAAGGLLAASRSRR